MRIKLLTVILLFFSFVITGCDSMFESWFDTPSHERDVEWKLVDGPMGSLSDPYSEAYNHWIGVHKGEIYVAWCDTAGYVYIFKYNGDDEKPGWFYHTSLYLGSINAISYCSWNGMIMYAYSDGNNLYIRDMYGASWGDGIQYSSPVGAMRLFVYNGMLHVVFEQNGLLRMKRYEDYMGSWYGSAESADIEDAYGYGINDSGDVVDRSRVAVVNGLLYAVFISHTSPVYTYQVKVRAYNGYMWSTVNSQLNYWYDAGTANFPSITGFNDRVIISWVESYGGENRLCVREAFGRWLDGGTGNNPGIRWGDDYSLGLQTTSLAVVNDNLCAFWSEQVNDPTYGSFDSVRGSVYNEDNNSYIPWDDITGYDNKGLNIIAGNYASDPLAVEYDNKLYVVFREINMNNFYSIHVKVAR